MKNIFRHPSRSLAAKLIIAISLLMIIGSFVFWYATLRKQEQDLLSIAVKYGSSFIAFIKESNRYSMLTSNQPSIQKTLEDISMAEGIKRVRIYDHKGKIQYSSNKDEIKNAVEINSLACTGCHANAELSAELLPASKKMGHI
ncbi:MAG: hypothetical protein HY758_00430 [Nitrospirae bacterium]|nr:hypothetical protein [Nitrospirota bacterium]